MRRDEHHGFVDSTFMSSCGGAPRMQWRGDGNFSLPYGYFAAFTAGSGGGDGWGSGYGDQSGDCTWTPNDGSSCQDFFPNGDGISGSSYPL